MLISSTRSERAMTTALLLIDIQNDYFPNGKMELFEMDRATANVSKLLGVFRNKELPIYHIQHISNRPNATFFLPDTDGVKINNQVAPLASEMVIKKHYPNSFRNTVLLQELQKYGIKNLVIA